MADNKSTELEEVIDSVTEKDNSEAARADAMVQLLPVHAAPRTTEGGGSHALKMKRRQGRPRKVERAPNVSDLEYHAAMVEEKAKFIDTDAIVTAAKKHSDPFTMLAAIRVEVAKEAASLHFQRIEDEKLGRSTAQVSSRRIDALKKIADIELEIKKLGADIIDVHGEKFQMVFKLWIETIREIAMETMTAEQIDLFFNRLSTAMEGWEEKVEDALR